jgi:mRNA interferase RelE/StbE
MMRALLSPLAQRQVADLPKAVRARLDGLIQRLERWPDVSGVKPLGGKLVGRYRVRTGDYRVVFHVKGHEIVVERIAHRKDVYES